MDIPLTLLGVGVIALLIAGVIKNKRSENAKPVDEISGQTTGLEEPVAMNIQEDTVQNSMNVDIQNEDNRVDFGFVQGFKFAVGFWLGTAFITVILAILFGSIFASVLNSALHGVIFR